MRVKERFRVCIVGSGFGGINTLFNLKTSKLLLNIAYRLLILLAVLNLLKKGVLLALPFLANLIINIFIL